MSLIAVMIKEVLVPLRAMKSAKVIINNIYRGITMLIIRVKYHHLRLQVILNRHIRNATIIESLILGRISILLVGIRILTMLMRLSMMGVKRFEVVIKSRRRKIFSKCSSFSSMMRDRFHSSNIINSLILIHSPKLPNISSHSIVIWYKTLGKLWILTWVDQEMKSTPIIRRLTII